MKIKILLFLFIGFLFIGCSSENKVDINSGDYCKVQIKRNILGASTKLPISPTTENINGAQTCVKGKFIKDTGKFIVIEKNSHQNCWISKENILLIQVNK